uniref:Attachment glycoprotein n=1 Tax=Bat paramyxovirus TaxID=1300978 RepID=A0A0D3MC86_9MONO|nr:attachment glycoprotein [Bat paramyxovirus]
MTRMNEQQFKRELKSTWKLAFRIITWLFLIALLCLTSISLTKIYNVQIKVKSIPELNSVTPTLSQLTSLSEDEVNQLGLLNHAVSVTLPFSLKTIGQSITAEVSSLIQACSARCVNPSGGQIMHDAAFRAGINTEMFSNPGIKNLHLNPTYDQVIQFDNPNTFSGCTRLPSFSIGDKVWCYSFTHLTANCTDNGNSVQHLSLGIINSTSTGGPGFIAVASKVLYDTYRRSSCSVTAFDTSCVLLCLNGVSKEEDMYQTRSVPELVMTQLTQDGSVRSGVINGLIRSHDFVAIVPGVGSGVKYNDHLLFPIYGGVDPRTNLGRQLSGQAMIFKDDITPCANIDSDPQLNRTAILSYNQSWYGSNIMVSGILSCTIGDDGPTSCNITVFSPAKVSMGSEGKLMIIGNNLLYYQRSSSWWPYPLLFRLIFDAKSAPLILTNIIWIPIRVAPRPGTSPCTGLNTCPGTCITGVFSSVWPLSLPSVTAKFFPGYVFVAGTLDHPTERLNPTLRSFNAISSIDKVHLGDNSVAGGYSDTTCIKNTIADAVFCLTLFEMSSKTGQLFTINPIIYSVSSNREFDSH